MEVSYKLNLLRESDLVKYNQFYHVQNISKALIDFDEKLRQIEKNEKTTIKFTIDEIRIMFLEVISENGVYLEDIKE